MPVREVDTFWVLVWASVPGLFLVQNWYGLQRSVEGPVWVLIVLTLPVCGFASFKVWRATDGWPRRTRGMWAGTVLAYGVAGALGLIVTHA